MPCYFASLFRYFTLATLLAIDFRHHATECHTMRRFAIADADAALLPLPRRFFFMLRAADDFRHAADTLRFRYA